MIRGRRAIFSTVRKFAARVLYTDNDMLPASQNGFTPVVRGIAKSNATVIIRQNGYVIYQSAVPQRCFEITDLNTAQYRWRLDVTIKEEDGSEQRFTQPYASLAILKREGQTDVDVSVGELRDEDGYRTSFRRKYFMVSHGSLYMEVCRLLKIMVLQLWVSVKILALWAQFLSM